MGNVPNFQASSPQPLYQASTSTVQGYSAAGYTIQPQISPCAGAAGISRQILPPTQSNVLNGPGYTVGAYEQKHQSDYQLQNLKSVRELCGLRDIPVATALLNFKRAGGPDGKIYAQDFYQVYFQLLQMHQVPIPAEDIQRAVFDLFDRDDNQVVDMMELVC